MTYWDKPIVLASSSARRASLLLNAGIEVIQCPPSIDDGVFRCGSMSVSRWVQTLAVLKAQHVRLHYPEPVGTVLAADTVCVVDECILGQPTSEEDARASGGRAPPHPARSKAASGYPPTDPPEP